MGAPGAREQMFLKSSIVNPFREAFLKEDCQDLYQAREKRVLDAIALRTPDRVPITVSFYFLPTRLYGCNFEEIRESKRWTRNIQRGRGRSQSWRLYIFFSRMQPSWERRRLAGKN
jgi:hypothetical protein